MMKKKRIIALLAAFLLTLPLAAVLGERNLAATLHSLRGELEQDYEKIFTAQGRLAERHGRQHDQMVSIMKSGPSPATPTETSGSAPRTAG